MTAPRLTWAALCACLALCACAGSRHAPVAPPTTAPENACIPFVEHCELTGTAAACDGAEACVNLWARASLEWSWRRELEEAYGVDAAVHAGQVADYQRRVGELEVQRWYWLAGGTAGGAVLILILGLAL